MPSARTEPVIRPEDVEVAGDAARTRTLVDYIPDPSSWWSMPAGQRAALVVNAALPLLDGDPGAWGQVPDRDLLVLARRLRWACSAAEREVCRRGGLEAAKVGRRG